MASINQTIASNPNTAFTAGWIVTLQRANELNLSAWSPSDFYGGLQGFLASFGVTASTTVAGVGYENFTLSLSGGTLKIGTYGTNSAGPGFAPASTIDANSQAAQVYRIYDVAYGQHAAASDVTTVMINFNLHCQAGQDDAVTPTAAEAASFATATADGRPTLFNTEDIAVLEGLAARMLISAVVQTHLGGVGSSDTAYVTALYTTAFKRAPTASELSGWTQNLAAGGGWTRAGMLALFSEWHDHRDVRPVDPNGQQAQIIRLYDTVLGRAAKPSEVWTQVDNLNSIYAAGGAGAVVPTAAEAAGFASTVTDGLPAHFNTENMAALEGAAAALMATPAAVTRLGGAGAGDVAFINAAWLAAFRRAPAAWEVSAWQNNFAAGWTRAGFVTLLSEWHDHRARMGQATPNGVSWLSNVGQGVLSLLPQASADGRGVTAVALGELNARRPCKQQTGRGSTAQRRLSSTRSNPRNMNRCCGFTVRSRYVVAGWGPKLFFDASRDRPAILKLPPPPGPIHRALGEWYRVTQGPRVPVRFSIQSAY